MEANLQKDIRKLLVDANMIKEGLDTLRQDCSDWARGHEDGDLAQLVENLKQAEIDVSMMMTDCISVGRCREEEGMRATFDDLQKTFLCLGDLFDDLKKARLELKKAYIQPSVLGYLEINYGRFSKTIGRIQKHLMD
jgi:aryl carrier-like protein